LVIGYAWPGIRGAFWERCVVNPNKVFDGHPCWEWTGSVNHNGYGHYSDGKRPWLAHRWIALLLSKKRNKAKLHTDHRCENKRCVNPRHLELVTLVENVKRAHQRAAAVGIKVDRRAWNHR
jgi:hypothetical protein